MSIDLDWHKLDSSLASSLVDLLNRQLANTQRPSFIGPVEVTSLDFGSVSPDAELVDLRDIYRDFLEDDAENDDGHSPVKETEVGEDDDGFEWVSRRAARKGVAVEGPAYHHLPPHVRYGRGPAAADLFMSTPSLHTVPRDVWSGSASVAGLGDFRPIAFPAYPMPPLYRGPLTSPIDPFPNFEPRAPPTPPLDDDLDDEPPLPPAAPDQPQHQPAPPENNHPNLQLHLHITWHSNLRITLTTSLLINYPSPMFMSLPIKLSVSGLVFNGEVAVAYEGARQRVHLCILDDMDPYGPAGDRPKRSSQGSTPPDLDDESPPARSGTSRPVKPLPVGQRLLPSILIESEIGQADKHVLKNVTRVERFIQDVIRKTVEEELVFPNFHTLLMGER